MNPWGSKSAERREYERVVSAADYEGLVKPRRAVDEELIRPEPRSSQLEFL
jgi:hypothetical protein